MKPGYCDAITQMEEMKVQAEYILGWQGGFLRHPMREQQRLTEAYEAGYSDGGSRLTENFDNWLDLSLLKTRLP